MSKPYSFQRRRPRKPFPPPDWRAGLELPDTIEEIERGRPAEPKPPLDHNREAMLDRLTGIKEGRRP